MRLTLRTLLAYMDDMLDPSDQEELGRKIEASPFATELIHRSRDAVRRLRLSAPDPLAGASGDIHGGDHHLDANTAAEYLDNILSPDDVAEFERRCLEAGTNADMLLAEAVSCHHILTLVLGEPAEVDADLRQRMYEIAAHSGAAASPQQVRIEPAHVSPASGAPPMAAPAAPARPAPEPEADPVPDYIREAARVRRRQRRAVAAVLAAAIGGGAATWWIMTSGESKVPDDVAAAASGVDAAAVQLEVGGDGPAAGAASGVSAGTGSSDAPAWSPPAASEAPAFAGGAADAEPGDAPSFGAAPPPVDAGEAPAPVGVGDRGAVDLGAQVPIAEDLDAEDLDADDVPLPAADGSPPPAGATADAAPAVEIPLDDVAGATFGGEAPPPLPVPGATATIDAGLPDGGLPTEQMPVGAIDLPDPADLAAAAGATASAAPASDAAADAAGAAAPAGPQQLATYFGNNDLLLRYDAATSAWLRLPARSALASGARLLVLPGFRTHVAINGGVNAFLGGGTEVVLMTAADAGVDAQADFGLAVPFGRVILNSGTSGNRIALTLGDETRVAALGPSSSLALEVRRLFVPGTDPARESYPLQITWYLTTGSVEWSDAAGASQSAEGQATWMTLDGVDEPPHSIDELPAWLNAEPLTSLEESARDVIEKELKAGQAAAIPLLELTDAARLGRRAEVRTLASRAGSYIGQFEPLVNALSDMNERPRWKERVETLREAAARDPESLELIAKAFAVQRGKDAVNDLMEMLLGYDPDDVGASKEEIQNGALLHLIDRLNNEDLSYRVLASYNINEITGTVSLGGYRPEHVASKRKGEIQFYWRRLEDGQLTPRAWTPTGWAPR